MSFPNYRKNKSNRYSSSALVKQNEFEMEGNIMNIIKLHSKTIIKDLSEIEVPQEHCEMPTEEFGVLFILDALKRPNQTDISQLPVHPDGCNRKPSATKLNKWREVSKLACDEKKLCQQLWGSQQQKFCRLIGASLMCDLP